MSDDTNDHSSWPKSETARLPYLTFRVPGNNVSKTRQKEIETEIGKQKEMQKRLTEERDQLWEKCHKELDDLNININPEFPGGQIINGAKGLKLIYDELHEHLQQVANGLKAAISLKVDATVITTENLRRQKEWTVGALDWERRDLKRYQTRIKSLDKISKKLQEDLEILRADIITNAVPAQGQDSIGENRTSEDINLIRGENGPEQKMGPAAPENEKWSIDDLGNEQDGGNIPEAKDDEDDYHDSENEEGESFNGEEVVAGLKRSRTGLEPSRSKKRARREQGRIQKEIESLEKKLGENNRAIQEEKEGKKKKEAEISKLQSKLEKLEREMRDLEKVDISGDEEGAEEERQETDPEDEKEGQYRRKERLEDLLDQWVRHRYHRSRRSALWGARREEKIVDGGLFEEVDKILRKIQDLEATFASVLQAKKGSEKVENLIEVLKLEMSMEQRIIRSLAGPQNAATSQGGHLNSVPPKYESLGKGEIRLLILWPAPASHYPLICSLRNRSLDLPETEPAPAPVRTRKYAALSYYWGPDHPEAYIYLRQDDFGQAEPNKENWGSVAKKSRRIPVRLNLFRALLRLRQTKKSVTLWVDFLCINQIDIKEKTAQLREMVKIYRQAENVCVWLGEPDDRERSDKAMKFIGEVKDFAMLDTYAEDKRRAHEWYGISELMRDRWFSRRWVVQEIALAKEATIHCGSKTVRWQDFVDAVSILVSNQARIKLLFDPKVWRDGHGTLGEVQFFGANTLIEELGSLFWRAEDGTIMKPVKSLESLVTSLKTFDTSDERDLIYSLIFIASDTWGQDGYTELMIDYKRDPADVYKDFIEFCIKSAKSASSQYPLDIICRPWALPVRSRNEKDGPALPSWIALLSNSVFGEPEQFYKGRKNGETFVGSTGQSSYRASRDMKYIARFDPAEINDLDQSPQDPDKLATSTNNSGESPELILPRPFPWSLVVKGFKLAEIEKVSPKSTGGLILQESLRMGGWPGIENMQDNAEYVPDKIWRTLVANKDTKGRVPPTWYQRACLRCLEIADNFNGGDLNVGQLLQGGSGMMHEYLTRVRTTIWNRCFFTARITQKPPDAGILRTPTFETLDGNQPENNLASIQNGARPTQNFYMKDIYGDKGENGSGGSASTEPLKLFGLCPSDTDVKDLVCIIYGCSVPVILRLVIAPGPLKPRYSIIGEAYVHGEMDGEAIDSYKAGWAFGAEQEFHLM
ncbi:hypothetical protein TWF506_005877 [Arthrobotrys conoides]|uniref:Heterokaryon incompatibility domain-containing protein n=1 Tax=Arthrobotrys conoides TaxID=74498 RepID=A0AAN8PQ79_9PEZI